MSDGDFEFVESIIAPLWDIEVEQLRQEQADVLLIWSATGFVDNGGFASLVECLGGRADEVPEALRRVGLPRRAEAVEAGLALFPRRADEDIDARLAIVGPLESTDEDAILEGADTRFYCLDEIEPVELAVASYIRAHLASFPSPRR